LKNFKNTIFRVKIKKIQINSVSFDAFLVVLHCIHVYSSVFNYNERKPKEMHENDNGQIKITLDRGATHIY